jgi:hypothetical protein
MVAILPVPRILPRLVDRARRKGARSASFS